MGKKTDPGTSIEHSLKSGAEASEILAGIACTNTALRLATRQLTNLYDEALEPTELKATQAALLAQMRHWLFERRPSDEYLCSRQPGPGDKAFDFHKFAHA